MPIAKLKILSVSSEDKNHTASNLLQQEHGKKWRTLKYEKSATVLIGLEERSKIIGIDIGNEHSAFVAVLVGNSLDSTDTFHEILPASSFMTPSESRNSTNPNRVRCFAQEALLPSIASEQWQMVKIVCTQPFNMHIPYGLAFIKIHVMDTKPKSEVRPSANQQCNFNNPNTKSPKKIPLKVRKDSSDSNSDDLFQRWKLVGSQNNEIENSLSKTLEEPKTTNAATSSNKVEQVILRNSPKPYYRTNENTKKDHRKEHSNEVKRKQSFDKKSNVSKATKGTTTYRNFNRLLNGVTFVISGIQNPERSDIRRKAIALGGRYEPDWTKNCTHLICAFSNTPKYNEVKGKGKIVNRDWIEECYTKKKYLPWRKYALDDEERAENPSDSEIWDKSLEKEEKGSTQTTEKEKNIGNESKVHQTPETDKENRKRKVPDDAYEISTDEEQEPPKRNTRSKYFFEGFKFFINPNTDFTTHEKTRITNIINEFHGVCSSSVNECDFVISTNKRISSPFQSKLIRPDWLFECEDMEMIVPKTPYLFNE